MDELSMRSGRRSSKGEEQQPNGLSDSPAAPPSSGGIVQVQAGREGQPESSSLRSSMSKDQPKDVARLGQYNVIRTLGEGSFGKVKLATHQVSGQIVALKIIARRKLVTRDMAGRIEREISYLQLLRHPHIIKLFTVITTPAEIIMVLEYAGGELFDYIVQNGKMAEDKARKFFQQIVCAVEYCHRHKIVHRDLKPENLLLDENLNVKIADFGLSNIMTDGNFLKTSCGSPNYAAPEVISGKLYAGPEVDVWSCGIILYVLLVGRLPFDDEYIPALFKKIAQGNYMVPNYLSSGAIRLIRKMLQVNPVNRITVEEIRSDAWFKKDLAEYLQPPVDEFIDTGVDPNRAIDPYALSKGKPKPVQEKLHNAVIGKLGKTMGYAPDDVQEALGRDEPSAIKDAYLILRENQLMKTNPSLAADQPAFMAQSPPAFETRFSGVAGIGRPMSPTISRPPMSPLGFTKGRTLSTDTGMSIEVARLPASTIAVLPSSLPDYHRAYMQGRTQSPTKALEESEGDSGRPRTKEDRAYTARMIKGMRNNSSTALNSNDLKRVHAHVDKPEGMTPMPEKRERKPKPTKWQFGIRSRNTPAEAMLAIYKALRKMGAVWEESKVKGPNSGGGSREDSPEHGGELERREDEEPPEYSDSDPEPGTDPEYASDEEKQRRRRRRAEQGRRGRERYGRYNDWGYTLPEDPWVIQARFKKDGMFPPGVQHPSSTHSSRVDLTVDSLRRRSSMVSSAAVSQAGSAAVSTENVAATGPGGVPQHATGGSVGNARPYPDESVWVYVTIQLYSIEKDFYLVDFKCAGYERLVRRFARHLSDSMSSIGDGSGGGKAGSNGGSGGADVELMKSPSDAGRSESDLEEGGYEEDEDGTLVGAGRTEGEKNITSPFPFLDVASRLIIQLAESGD